MHLLEFNILIKVQKKKIFDYQPIARFFLLLKILFTVMKTLNSFLRFVNTCSHFKYNVYRDTYHCKKILIMHNSTF